MKLITSIVYAPSEYDKDIGRAYNEIMERTDAEYVAFLDHDAMFTTKDWYHQICEIIETNPDAGLFTAKTNRIWAHPQRHEVVKGHDVLQHRQEGKKIQSQSRNKVSDYPLRARGQGYVSGVLMVVKKEAWKKVKFTGGFLGVDNNFHRDVLAAGYRALLMEGVYLYHFYRGDGDKSHLKK